MKLSIEMSREHAAHLALLNPRTVAWQNHGVGLFGGEALILAMEALLEYAKAYRLRYECDLADDHVLGDDWLQAICSVRGLLNGQGSVAMRMGSGTDSKDNGVLEGLFWDAIRIAGFSEADVK